MAMKYTDEKYHQITLEEVYEIEVKPNLFAVSRIFAEAHKQMNLAEYKTFTLGLSRIDWTQACPDTIYLDKKELAAVIGIHSDIDHLSQDLKRSIGQMPRHSFIEFDEKGKEFYVSGNFVRTIAMFKNVVRIRIEDEFLGLFGNLDAKKEVSKYITMWSGDIFGMKSERAVLFYELLRDNSDTRLEVNSGTVSIKKFKEMFGIPEDGKGSYMVAGHFSRASFEAKVIDPVCEELTKTNMITLVLTSEGKYYEKVKRGNRVLAYLFHWTINGMRKKEETEEKAKYIEAKPLNLADTSDSSKDADILKYFPPEFLEKRDLWEETVEELKFSQEEIEAIRSRLYLVPPEAMPDNGAVPGDININRFHFMQNRVKDMLVIDKKTPINNKCKYLIRILENDYIPKGIIVQGEDKVLI